MARRTVPSPPSPTSRSALAAIASGVTATAVQSSRPTSSDSPNTVTSTEEIREAMAEPVSAIVDAVQATLDKTPPELAADIVKQGIVLTDGGAPPRPRCPSGRRDRYDPPDRRDPLQMVASAAASASNSSTSSTAS